MKYIRFIQLLKFIKKISVSFNKNPKTQKKHKMNGITKATKTLFDKIILREIPSTILFEDNQVNFNNLISV